MKLYNSYSQTIEELKPIEEGKISMYVCGPTVYNYPHIGNARPIVVFDTLKKALSAQGFDVTFASNYTDVDDKIIKTAIEQNVSEKEITDKFIDAYNDVRRGLHADLPDYAPRVTETMDKIIEFIDKMIKNGSAYQVGGDVYFRVNSDAKYGELSHQSIDDLMVGARIDENEKKEKMNLVRLSYKIGGAFVILCFFVIILCWAIVHYVLSEQYTASFQYIPWIILSSTIYSFYGLVIQYPYTVKKTFGLGLVTFSGSVLQLLLTFVLVKTIGADGIKYSLVLGSLVIMLSVWWYSNKVYPMPWFSRL